MTDTAVPLCFRTAPSVRLVELDGVAVAFHTESGESLMLADELASLLRDASHTTLTLTLAPDMVAALRDHHLILES